MSSVQGHVSGRSDLRLRSSASGRSSRSTTTRRFTLTREQIERRPKNLWRYRELLPITGEPRTGFNSGFTPLVRCTRLAERLGVSELYIKDDSVNHPTLSYKDRVVSVAATRAVELGLQGAGVRVHRQPRQQRRGARRAPRHRVLRVHPRQPRSRASCSARRSSARRFSPSPATTTM